ncbi:MAG TPA: hypothetical protein VKR32_05410 [Puia sp.]|nr:hypothetical protein [Puia sp.]
MKFLFAAILTCCVYASEAQGHKTENIIIVTMDGMRWQEVFGGIDSVLMMNKRYTHDSAGAAKYWDADIKERRKKLFPFFWTTIASEGQLYGNRTIGSLVDNANPYKFSYPGYNEIFTGYPDSAVNSNDKIYNKNTTVLEFLNKQKTYAGKVAVFATWDAYPYIFNVPRSGIYVNADFDTLNFNNGNLRMINDIQFLDPRNTGERPDVLTYVAAREYLKAYKPKILYIAFDETDDYAHAGQYNHYLNSAHAEDGMIANLWNLVQTMSEYRGKTTLIVTCDHGRGDKIKDQWRDHGQRVEDAGHIWIAAMGPDTPPFGEVKPGSTLYQKQIAPTIAALLGQQFYPDHGEAKTISTFFQ